MVEGRVPELTGSHLDALSLVLTDEALDHVFVALVLLHVSESSFALVSQFSHKDLIVVSICWGRGFQSGFNDLLDGGFGVSRTELILDGRLELMNILLNVGTFLDF